MACPSNPPCRFDTKVESQIQLGVNPVDSINPENALVFCSGAGVVVMLVGSGGLQPDARTSAAWRGS
jgi:hypothetical protein